MPRLFTAIAIPDEADQILDRYVLTDEKVIIQKDKHITLQFIGNVTEPTASAIEKDLEVLRMKPFELVVAGCEIFKSHGTMRIVVAKVERHKRLNILHQQIGDIIARRGIALDKRRYKPHITLTRLSQPNQALIDNLQAKANEITMTLFVDRFVLYSVHAGKTPRYIKRREYRLQ
jgi:2'-5' RNA ligase